MKIKESEMEILERYFNNIYEDENSYEMETWTNKGVNMIVDIEKDGNSLLEQLKDYVDNFDIDYEIDLHREDERYRNDFTIEESLEDFKDYINYLKSLINELEHIEKKYTYEDFDNYTLEESLEILKREVKNKNINADDLIVDIEEELAIEEEHVLKCNELIQEIVDKLNEEG